jgi:predicted DNA binding CopG/RHH family protein
MNLDSEEIEILEAYESGKLTSVPDLGAELRRHREIAEATFRKDQRITIRISGRDLNALRQRALVEGIPYQTLVASILHKYVDGRLIEKPYEMSLEPK